MNLTCADIDVIEGAAAIIEGEARCLRESHTIPGAFTDWTGDEAVKVEHDEWLKTAAGLRGIAERARRT